MARPNRPPDFHVPADVIIVPALPEDLPAILDLQVRAFRSEAVLYGDFAMPPLRQTLEEIRAESLTRLILKLETLAPQAPGGRIVATARAHLDSGGTCHIGRVCTDPAHRGRGYATALMHALETRFSDARRFELSTGWKSDGNLRLYRRLGYLPVRDIPAGPGYCMTIMEKMNRKPEGPEPS